MPWDKVEDKTARAIVSLKSFLETKIAKAIEIEHALVMGQLSIFKMSEQIKYTRLEQRLNALEACFKLPLEVYHKKLNAQVKKAAEEIDRLS